MRAAPDNLVFFAGIPTEPDVAKLRKHFGVPKEGDFITYESMEECVTGDRGSSRFKTVINSWRKELYREHNLVLVAVPNRGFTVATPSERVHVSSAKYKGGLKRIIKAGDIALKTEAASLSPDELRAKDHVVNASAALRLAAATAAKSIRLTDSKPNGK